MWPNYLIVTGIRRQLVNICYNFGQIFSINYAGIVQKINYLLLPQTLFKWPVYSALDLHNKRGYTAKDILDSDRQI